MTPRLIFPLLLAVAGCAPRGDRDGAALPPRAAGSFDVDLHGNVYLLDAARNTLTLQSNEEGRPPVTAVGGPGWRNGEFDRPAQVWARNGIDVFVADYGNHRIQRFDRSLAFVSSLSTREAAAADARFGYPTDVALSRMGDLYVCDGENVRVLKVSGFDKVQLAFGGIGAGAGRLSRPVQVEIGPQDRIYVLDGRRVAVFDAFGNYLRDLLPGVLRSPRALFADERGVAVLDSATILTFDENERPEGTMPLSALTDAGPAEVTAFVLAREQVYLLVGGGVRRAPDPRVVRPGPRLDNDGKNR